MTDPILLTPAEAGQLVGMSDKTIRRAIRATDPNSFPPPLAAKVGGKGRLLILRSELERWAESLADA